LRDIGYSWAVVRTVSGFAQPAVFLVAVDAPSESSWTAFLGQLPVFEAEAVSLFQDDIIQCSPSSVAHAFCRLGFPSRYSASLGAWTDADVQAWLFETPPPVYCSRLFALLSTCGFLSLPSIRSVAGGESGADGDSSVMCDSTSVATIDSTTADDSDDGDSVDDEDGDLPADVRALIPDGYVVDDGVMPKGDALLGRHLICVFDHPSFSGMHAVWVREFYPNGWGKARWNYEVQLVGHLGRIGVHVREAMRVTAAELSGASGGSFILLRAKSGHERQAPRHRRQVRSRRRTATTATSTSSEDVTTSTSSATATTATAASPVAVHTPVIVDVEVDVSDDAPAALQTLEDLVEEETDALGMDDEVDDIDSPGQQQQQGGERNVNLLTVESLKALQEGDPFCSAWLSALSGTYPTDPLKKAAMVAEEKSFMITKSGLLGYIGSKHVYDNNPLPAVVAPLPIQLTVLKLFHDDPIAGGHRGITGTLKKVAARFYWPGMAKDVQEYVRSCRCRHRKRSSSRRSTPQVIEKGEVWNTLAVDLMDMKTVTKDGNRYVLIVTELLTKWVRSFALATKEAMPIAKIMYHLFLEHGAPSELLSDQGPEFLNEVLSGVLLLFKVHKINTSLWHPQTDGQVERTNAVFAEMLTMVVDGKTDDWDEYLPVVTWCYMSTPHSFHGMTPFYAAYGRHPKQLIDVVLGDELESDDAAMNLEAFAQDRKRIQNEVEQIFREKFAARRELYSKRLGSNAREAVEYDVGDYVMVTEPVLPDSARQRSRQKTVPPKLRLYRSTGPWQVEQVVVPGKTYLVRMYARRVRIKTVHKADLRPYYVRPERLRDDRKELVSPSAPVLSLEERATLALQTQQPVQILERKKSGSSWLYQVKWLDGSVSDWLPETYLLDYYSKESLDCWHALYELYTPEDLLPDHARRCRRQKQYPTTAEALQKFPISTKVTRWVQSKAGDEEMLPVTGEISGYVRPYYRVRYDDGDWEELSSREVITGVNDFGRLDACRRLEAEKRERTQTGSG
jgi:hypothetical protein